MIGRVPIRNIWLLMLYASRFYRELSSSLRYAVEDNPEDIPNLAAEVLTRAVERRLRRNLSFDFQSRKSDLTRVRGRIDHLRSERRRLPQQGKIACSFDELTTNTPLNRFVKAGLQNLTKTISNRDLARRCLAASSALERSGVRTELSAMNLHRTNIPAVTSARINVEDQQMVAAARLAFELRIPTEGVGQSRLPGSDRDEVWARRLFEAAVGGFYDTVLSPKGWWVKTGRRLDWQIEDATLGIPEILPSMKTDIVLESPATYDTQNRTRTVIDTKFTEIVRVGQYGNISLSSGYIYQIYSYLRSQEHCGDPPSLDAAGLLLHPAIEGDVDEAVTIQGHRIRFATVDLAGDSLAIRNRLLSLAGMNAPRDGYS